MILILVLFHFADYVSNISIILFIGKIISKTTEQISYLLSDSKCAFLSIISVSGNNNTLK